jgi:integrase
LTRLFRRRAEKRSLSPRGPLLGIGARLRKAGATRAAERGASERQLMAIFGWSTGKMAQHYTRTADRARLAQAAAEFLMPQAK